MKRVAVVVGLIAVAVTPATAQWLGMPVWNSPNGGTGLTISADFGKPNEAYGSGTAWAGRASLGLATLTLTAGVATYKSEGIDPMRVTSYGGRADFRLIGGSLVPVAVNLQAGAVRTSQVEGQGQTHVIGAVGFSIPLPTPGVSIELYVSPGIRHRNLGPTNGSSTEFGYAIGANLSFGLLGAHLAYDYEQENGGGTVGVFGLGAHVRLRLPMGM